MVFSEEDTRDLHRAKRLLENPGLAVKITSFIGTPIEKGFELLPAQWSVSIHSAARIALEKALRFAVLTLGRKPARRAGDRMHKWLVAASGGVGGAFGLPALAIELPVSTTVMMRSIAAIARQEGEDLTLAETKLACVEVFALGGPSRADNAAETGYFALRAMLAQSLAEAARHITAKGLSQEGAPVIVRFIGQIASRFGIVVSEKAAAQALPVVGAAGGAMINTLFINHYQDMAHGHFIIRRLERHYGEAPVREAYENIKG